MSMLNDWFGYSRLFEVTQKFLVIPVSKAFKQERGRNGLPELPC
jgi:hypothetical protein